jgi:hypothetical protein
MSFGLESGFLAIQLIDLPRIVWQRISAGRCIVLSGIAADVLDETGTVNDTNDSGQSVAFKSTLAT